MVQEPFSSFLEQGSLAASSPDLNPIDFCVWSIMKADGYASSHDSVEALKGSLKKAWKNIVQEILRKPVDSFICRLERVIQARGRHIEKNFVGLLITVLANTL